MNKVYIVMEVFIDEEYVDVVFKTKEGAEKYIASCENPHKYGIDEQEVLD